jgi:hypothetical protein
MEGDRPCGYLPCQLALRLSTHYGVPLVWVQIGFLAKYDDESHGRENPELREKTYALHTARRCWGSVE